MTTTNTSSVDPNAVATYAGKNTAHRANSGMNQGDNSHIIAGLTAPPTIAQESLTVQTEAPSNHLSTIDQQLAGLNLNLGTLSSGSPSSLVQNSAEKLVQNITRDPNEVTT